MVFLYNLIKIVFSDEQLPAAMSIDVVQPRKRSFHVTGHRSQGQHQTQNQVHGGPPVTLLNDRLPKSHDAFVCVPILQSRPTQTPPPSRYALIPYKQTLIGVFPAKAVPSLMVVSRSNTCLDCNVCPTAHHCSITAPGAPNPLLYIQSVPVKSVECYPQGMCEGVQQGQRIVDHQVAHGGGVLHAPASGR